MEVKFYLCFLLSIHWMRTGLGPENRNGGKTPPHFLQHLSFVGIMRELSLTFLSSYGDRNYKVCLCRGFPHVLQLLQSFSPPPHSDQPYKGHFPFHLAQSPFSLNVGGLLSVRGINQTLLLWEKRSREEKGSQAHLTISEHGSLFSGLLSASGRTSL